MRRVEIYTDGACIPNPGVGGWAYVVVEKSCIVETYSGTVSDTTNNRMEYTALIEAIERHGDCIEKIHTDANLLVNTCMSWRHRWKLNGWSRKKNSNSSKYEIKNLDLVQRIDELLNKFSHIQVLWVKGHNGNEFNEAADDLANRAALSEQFLKRDRDEALRLSHTIGSEDD